MVIEIRKKLPETSTRKLIDHFKEKFVQKDIKMGRDAIFDLLRYRGLFIRRTKLFHITTDSKHYFINHLICSLTF
jgi:hypothetical protein